MKLLLLTLDITEKGRPVQVSYEPWDDVFVYINTKDTLPISPEWIIKTKFKAQFLSLIHISEPTRPY